MAVRRIDAAKSPKRTAEDQPSHTMWWTVTISRCRSAASRTSVARSNGPAARSNGCVVSTVQDALDLRRRGNPASDRERSITGRAICDEAGDLLVLAVSASMLTRKRHVGP